MKAMEMESRADRGGGQKCGKEREREREHVQKKRN